MPCFEDLRLGLGLGLITILAFFTVANGECLRPNVLIVSFDGFRHDYFLKNASPNMMKLRSFGTYAEHMKNVFPTKTFPNHHSIATGVYPEVHGVMSNEIFDPKLGRKLTLDEMWNYNKELVPIWTLNENTDECHSGTVMWPGTSVPYQNKLATFNMKYNVSVTWEDRVDAFLSWYENPSTPVNLVVAYFEEPDYLSHKYGPDSDQVLEQIKKVDNITQYIYERLESLKLTVDVILLSDHGMEAVTKPKVITVGKSIDNSTFQIYGSSPFYHIWPKNPKDKSATEVLYKALKEESVANQHFSVYLKDDIPSEWHYKNNSRLPPIIAIADLGYGFQDLLMFKVPNFTVDNSTWGVHGYVNTEEKMWPFFMAWGPNIKVDHKVADFDTVDLYSLFCQLLQLTPPPNNGTLANVRDILLGKEAPLSILAVLGITITVLIIIVGGLLIAFFTRRADKKRPRRNDGHDTDPARAKPEDNPLLDPINGEQRTEVV